MIVIGISEEGDAGVAVIRNSRIIYAVNEERFTRKKLQSGFPHKSLQMTLDYLRANSLTSELKGVALAGEIHIREFGIPKKPTLAQRILGMLSDTNLAPYFIGTNAGIEAARSMYKKLQSGRIKGIKRLLSQYGLGDFSLNVFDHHLCHAYSAYFTSGFNDCLTITLDAAGDGYCSRVYECHDAQMKLLHSVPFFHSIGYYYTLVTFILGFKEGQQGKVTGLSARGNPETTLPIFEEKIPYNSERMLFDNKGKYYFYEMPELKKRLDGFSREDISAGIQKHLEKSVTSYIRDLLRSFNHRNVNLALAGGVFANVLLNRAVARIDGVNQVFVHPHMGDGGLATGAAFAMFKGINPETGSYKMEHVYFGCEFSDVEIEDELRNNNLNYRYCGSIEVEVARLIADGKVVARFEGKMEYGPRALGHRSVLYHAKDPSVNTWLNNRLKRSEFMPFAPAVLEEYTDEYFINENQHHPAYFMTIVTDTTEKCKKECPAIVHVDGTARPQIVNRDISPSYYKIIDEYRKLTGIPVVVNTSFNMHEEPIVDSPKTAVDAFLRGHLDYLAIGKFLVKGMA